MFMLILISDVLFCLMLSTPTSSCINMCICVFIVYVFVYVDVVILSNTEYSYLTDTHMHGVFVEYGVCLWALLCRIHRRVESSSHCVLLY